MRLLYSTFCMVCAMCGFWYAIAVANGHIAPTWLIVSAFVVLGIINVFHAVRIWRD